MTTVCVTGHRPNKLGGYSKDAQDKLYVTARKTLDLLDVSCVVTGMALGWDQAIAKACLDKGIQFIAALPFPGQENSWPKQSQEQYRELLKHAFHIQVVNPPPYRPHKMHERNEWKVNHSDKCIALWNGDHEGDTFNCVRYAMVCGKPVLNAWDLYNNRYNYLTAVDKL